MAKIKTRDRILDTSLALFNALGEPNVTTLLISDELDISPGNLYYHFNNKSNIVSELFDGFELQMHDLLSVPADANISLDQQNFFLHLLFEAVAHYRFLYQDLVNVLSRHPRLQPKFRKILKLKNTAFHTICTSFRAQGFMTIGADELETLCDQLTLTTCYWSSFDTLSHLDDRNAVDPGRGVYQTMSLMLPYLAAEEKEQALLISRSYL
jgi:AcrR family transcriptional regulator